MNTAKNETNNESDDNTMVVAVPTPEEFTFALFGATYKTSFCAI